MKKRILSLVLCICMVLSIAPVIMPATTAQAATATYEFYESTNTENFFTIDLDGSGKTDGSTNSSGSISVNGDTRTFITRFKLTKNGTITLNSKDAGTLTVVWKAKNHTITVGGTNVTITDDTVKCESFELNAGTSNHTITGASGEVYLWYIGFTPASDTTDCTHTDTIVEVPAVAASCKDGNIAHYTCTQCNALFSDAEGTTTLTAEEVKLAATGVHSYGDVTYTWADDHSTCTAVHTCTVCENEESASAVVEITNTATCTEAGTKTWTATFTETWATETTYREDSAATGHNWSGNDGTCSTCSTECEHGWANKDGTCTICGMACTHSYGDDSVCTVCGHDRSCTHDSTRTHVEAKAATCIAAGNIEYWECTCGAKFDAATGGSEITDVTVAIDTASGHSYTSEVTKEATCTEKGVTTYTCSLCDDTYTEEIAIDADAHTWVDEDEANWIQPSCIAAGSKKQTCACGAEQTVVLPAGHTYGEKGVCIYEGNVLLNCGAGKDSKYIHSITTDGMTDKDGFFTITGEEDSTDLDTVIYNGLTLNKAIKMNTSLKISFTVPTNTNEGDDYDGIMILVGSESRTNKNGEYVITTLTIAVSDGTTTTNYKIMIPSDGIIMFAVTNGYTYTITKTNGENPLYYFEYVPGANLATASDDGTGDDTGDTDTGTGDGFVTFVAEIGAVQYLTLAEAVADAQPGDIIGLLADISETVTVGENLAVGETITICDHGHEKGTINPATGCVMNSQDCDNGYKDWIITRTEAATSADPTEGKVAYVDEDGNMEYTEGEDLYADLSELLELAGNWIKNGTQTSVYIGLVNNTTETYVIIPVGVTLDLEEYTLTADYVVGFNDSFVTADRYSASTAYGKLIVDSDQIVLGETAYVDGREIMPIWDSTNNCFVFARLGPMSADETADFGMEIVEATDTTPEAIKFKWKYNGGGSAIDEYLADGAEDNELSFVVRLVWTNDQGTAYQDFTFKDEYVTTLAQDTTAYFTFELKAFEELGIDISTLTIQALIISSTGVTAVSAECNSDALTG